MKIINDMHNRYIQEKFFDESECIEDFGNGYGCLFLIMIPVTFILVIIFYILLKQ
jgi:hypothetical protein